MKLFKTLRENGTYRFSQHYDKEDFDASPVDQSQAKDCDINIIYARTQKGELTFGNVRNPEYGDFTGIESYQDALTAIINAQLAFSELPSEERRKYGNDPEKWYNAVLAEAKAEHEAEQEEIEAKAKAEREAKEISDAKALIAKQPPTDES